MVCVQLELKRSQSAEAKKEEEEEEEEEEEALYTEDKRREERGKRAVAAAESAGRLSQKIALPTLSGRRRAPITRQQQ